MFRPSITGTNNIPLGKRRIGVYTTAEEQQLKQETPDINQNTSSQEINDDAATNTGNLLKRSNDDNGEQESDNKKERRNKRRSRWGNEESKVNIPGLPTIITSKMSKEQLDLYLTHLRLEEIGRKLRNGDFIPPEKDRSPSPEPFYDSQGKRVNTREYRYRKKLEDERHRLIEETVKKDPDFKPPADYKRPTKVQDKVYIPAKEFPEINFIGLLIGPRGNTLKKMETESGAKISIRGKGSVKEGKSRTDAAANSNQDEDLHCLVTADTEEKVTIAVKMIDKIIENSASVPEGQNELKRQQLRELAALNGTLRDDENQICTNCGATGHRKYECSESQNFTINLTCRICGGHGHTLRDCMERNNPEALQQANQREQRLDSEYLNLMAELGEDINDASIKTGHYGPTNAAKLPWAQAAATPLTPWAAAATATTSMKTPTVLSTVPPWQLQQPVASPTIPPPPGTQESWSAKTGSINTNTSSTTTSLYSTPPPPPPPGSSLPYTSATTVASSYYSFASTPTTGYTYPAYSNNATNYGNTVYYGTTGYSPAAAAGYPPPPPSAITQWGWIKFEIGVSPSFYLQPNLPTWN
ncbi:1451_t:CDS:2, partial [Entrophospora sp. SA101]